MGASLFLSLVSSPPGGDQIENASYALACVHALLAGLCTIKMSHCVKRAGQDGFHTHGAKPRESKKVTHTHRMDGENS